MPLCRGHHREVQRCGDEAAWWKCAGVDPILSAQALWLETHPLPKGEEETEVPLPLPVFATIEMAPSVIRRLAITAQTTSRPVTSLRQIESNRRNALKSTGPKITALQRHSQRSHRGGVCGGLQVSSCPYHFAKTTPSPRRLLGILMNDFMLPIGIIVFRVSHLQLTQA